MAEIEYVREQDRQEYWNFVLHHIASLSRPPVEKVWHYTISDLTHTPAWALHRNADLPRDPSSRARLSPSFDACFEIAKLQIAELANRDAEVFMATTASHSAPGPTTGVRGAPVDD